MESLPIADLLSICPGPSTRIVYASAMRAFLDPVCGPHRQHTERLSSTPDEQARDEDLATGYLASSRDHAADVICAIGGWTVAPKTMHLRVAATQESLPHHGIDPSLTGSAGASDRSCPRRGGDPAWRTDTGDAANRAGHLDERAQALVLVLASLEMRMGEAAKVRVSDLDTATSPAVIEIRGANESIDPHRSRPFDTFRAIR